MFPSDTKVLIVDDSSFARTMLKNNLRDLSFWKILEAANGKSAQDLMQGDEQAQDPVQLVIIDLHMPEVNGLAFLRWLRGHESFKEIPVIIVTSSQEKSEVFEAGKLGVSHYIVKPFDVDTLKTKLASTWQRHGQKTPGGHRGPV
jgi:two-component system chemotaxis response regulator CheY